MPLPLFFIRASGMLGAPMRVHDREDQIAREEELLSAQAAKSSQSKGRDMPEEEDFLRPCYQRDRDRILTAKSFGAWPTRPQVFSHARG